MRKLILSFAVIVICGVASYGQDAKGDPPEELVKYYFVELITNPDKPDLPKEKIDSIQRAHLANLDKLYNQGKLMIAGPFEGGGGLVILNVSTKDEAEMLIKNDPAVSADRLKYRIKGWWTAKGVFTAEIRE